MTFTDILNEFIEYTSINSEVIDDWRPANKLFTGGYDIPFSIIIWLKNGSKIIYYSQNCEDEYNKSKGAKSDEV